MNNPVLVRPVEPLSPIGRAPLAAYAGLAYLFTWSLGLPLLAARRGWVDFAPVEGLEAIAAFGPFIAALCVSWVLARRAGVREVLRGLVRWRVGASWLLFSIASPLALLALAAGIVRLTTGEWPDTGALASGRLATTAGIVHLLLVSGLVQGLGEEPGWRGFMLPRLLRRFTALGATLAVFPVWLIWHLPAFLGRPQFGIAEAVAFSVGVLSAAVWLTFIWENTASTLMAILWHTMINVARGIALAISKPMFLAMSTFVLAGAVVIIGVWLVRGRLNPRNRAASATPPGA